MTAIEFIRRQLGTAGWAPINLEMANELCPDVGSAHLTFTAWNNNPQALLNTFLGAGLVKVRVQGFGNVLVLSRCSEFLAERMGWLGFNAANVEPFLAPQVRATRAPETPAPATKDNAAALRKLAAQDPPAHDCDLRRQIIAARADLERLGITAEPAESP